MVISFLGTELKSRDVVVGLKIDDASRAYPWDTLVKQSPVVDHVHGTPLLVAVGPDGKSFRVFVSRIDGKDAEFFLKGETEGELKPETKSRQSPIHPQRTSPPHPEPKAAVSSNGKAEASPTATPHLPLHQTMDPARHHYRQRMELALAISGPAQGKCLDRIPALKDYWFDWRNYHPDTTIYKR